jgi:uncharacterized protein (TIGR02996 family)
MRPILLGDHYQWHHLLETARDRVLCYDLDGGGWGAASLRELDGARVTPGGYRMVGPEAWGYFATPSGPVLFHEGERLPLAGAELTLTIGDDTNRFSLSIGGRERAWCVYKRTTWRWGNDVLEEAQEEEYDLFLWLRNHASSAAFLIEHTAEPIVVPQAAARLSATSSSWADHVRAIRAAPFDDAPRLVCADWLGDRQDPRGEFIAVSCRIAALEKGDPALHGLHARSRELLQANEAAWREPLVSLGATPELLAFWRGFVGSAKLSGRAVANLSPVCRAEPVVRVHLENGGPGPCAAGAEAPELAELLELSFTGEHTEGIERIVASPLLGRVRSFQTHWMTPAIAAGIARGGLRPESINLANLAPAEIGALVESPFFDRVSELTLWGSDDVGRALGRVPLAALRRLDMSSSIGRRGLAALGERLDRLELLDVRVEKGALATLVEHVVSGRLTSLTVHQAEPEDLCRLVSSPALAGVERLDLAGSHFDDHVAAALVASPHRARLKDLRVYDEHAQGFTLPGVDIIKVHPDDDEGW